MTEGLIKQMGLEYKQEHNPRFRLYRAVKSQGRRREKGEDCLSGASSADPDGDRGDEPKSPITAEALLGSFFSLLRRMNNDLSTPLLRNNCFFGLSPIFCVAKHRGEV